MSHFTSQSVQDALENGQGLLGRLRRLLLLVRSRRSHSLARHWLLELIHISKRWLHGKTLLGHAEWLLLRILRRKHHVVPKSRVHHERGEIPSAVHIGGPRCYAHRAFASFQRTRKNKKVGSWKNRSNESRVFLISGQSWDWGSMRSTSHLAWLLLAITGSTAWNLEACRVFSHGRSSAQSLAFMPAIRPGLTLLCARRSNVRGIHLLRMRDGSEGEDRLVGTQFSGGNVRRKPQDIPRNGFQGRGRPERVGIGKEVPASWQEGSHYVMAHGTRSVSAHFLPTRLCCFCCFLQTIHSVRTMADFLRVRWLLSRGAMARSISAR